MDSTSNITTYHDQVLVFHKSKSFLAYIWFTWTNIWVWVEIDCFNGSSHPWYFSGERKLNLVFEGTRANPLFCPHYFLPPTITFLLLCRLLLEQNHCVCNPSFRVRECVLRFCFDLILFCFSNFWFFINLKLKILVKWMTCK